MAGFEGGIEVCFQSLRGESWMALDHGGISDCGPFSRRIFDCALGEANYVQAGHAGLCPIRIQGAAAFSVTSPPKPPPEAG